MRVTRLQASLQTTLSLCSKMQDCRAEVAQQALRVASVIPKSNQVSDV
jgi:ABC-type iron transport system FetAB permease component